MSNDLFDLGLPPSLQSLFDLLIGRGDVEIGIIYAQLGGPQDRAKEIDDNGRWYAQSWVGTYISRLNRKLVGMKVEPGALRGTYRLVANR